MMSFIFVGLLALVSSAFLVLAQEARPDNPEIQKVIGAQLDAFKVDDVTTAFTFAAPNIRQIFRTPENFGTMVQRGYPMVWKPGKVRFLELREISSALWQRVEIVDRKGHVHRLDYRMSRIEGRWRISAVQILPEPDVAV